MPVRKRVVTKRKTSTAKKSREAQFAFTFQGPYDTYPIALPHDQWIQVWKTIGSGKLPTLHLRASQLVNYADDSGFGWYFGKRNYTKLYKAEVHREPVTIKMTKGEVAKNRREHGSHAFIRTLLVN